MTALSAGARVVITIGPGQGLPGVIKSSKPSRPYGQRIHILADVGEDFWFMDHQGGVALEDSPEAKQALAAFAQRLEEPCLDKDMAFARRVAEERLTWEIWVAIERVLRHENPKIVDALLDIASVHLDATTLAGKPPQWVAPGLRALERIHDIDPAPMIASRISFWWPDTKMRMASIKLAEAFSTLPEVLKAIQEIAAKEPAPALYEARLRAGDETVYQDLAETRVVQRDGIWELNAGDLGPEIVEKVLARVAADRKPEKLNLVRGGSSAFGAIDLNAWLGWEGLRDFVHLDLSESFSGKKGVEALLKSPHLSPSLETLDLSACDIGQGGCGLLAKAGVLTNLKVLVLDTGDYDRSKWKERALERLFPKRGGLLTGLKRLSLVGWDLNEHSLARFVEARKLNLEEVCLSRGGWRRGGVL